MSSKNKYLGFLTLSVSCVALIGCSHPTSMPSGYTHHHKTYKSATPPPSPKVTTQQRQYMDAAQAEQFRSGVYDLLERLTNRAGMPPKPVYVLAPDPMTTFYANIDNDLREGMRHIGYAISDMPTGAYVFAYDAQLLDAPRGSISTGQPNVELVLKVFDGIGENARMLSKESGMYFIQGAEALHIQPSMYDNLPSRANIMAQESGYNTVQPRTVNQNDMPRTPRRSHTPPPSPTISKSYTPDATPKAAPVSPPAPELSYSTELPPPPSSTPRAPVSSNYNYNDTMMNDGPSYGTEIETRSGVSKWTDY